MKMYLKKNIYMFQKEKTENDIKRLYKLYDAWVYNMLDQGCLFFSLTINLCYFYNDKTKKNSREAEKDAYKYFKKLMVLFSQFPFIDCCLGSVEVDEFEINHLHCILAFRSNFNCKNIIQKKIELLLCNFSYLYDYKLCYLNAFNDVIKFMCYFSKKFAVSRPHNYAIFSLFSETLEFIHRPTMLNFLVDSCIEAIRFYTCVLYFDCRVSPDLLSNVPFGLYSTFYSIPKKLKNNVINEALYFLGVYFQYKKIILINDNFYIKIENTLISYKFLGDKTYIITHFYSFMEELKSTLFDFLDITVLSYIFSSNYKKILEQLSIILNFSFNKLNFDVLEFKDGLYFANKNVFYKKNIISKENSNLLKNLTTRYYNITYKYLNEIKIPNTWKKKLNVNFTEKDFIAFCIVFRDILFSNLIPTKKNILLCSGVSNSGKSKLILDIIVQSYGIQNTGFLAADTSFIFENLIGKELVVFDELIFKDNTYNMLKFLGSAEILPVNSKYQRTFSTRLTTKIIGVSNCNYEVNKLLEEDIALKNRTCFFMLNTVCPISSQEYQSIICEIPFILVYCNKLYFKELASLNIINNV